MIYNPNHQMSSQEIPHAKRDLPSSFNGTPPPKKKKNNDGLLGLPTPPPSSEFSSVANKMMVIN